MVGRNVDAEKTDARKTLTLGQYEIVQEKVPGTLITMTINDQTVEIGDRVRIARKIVRVNGVVREPENSESDGPEDSGSKEAAPVLASSEESEGSKSLRPIRRLCPSCAASYSVRCSGFLHIWLRGSWQRGASA